MLKKIGTTAAVLALAVSALTGCSSGKLPTDESCTFLNDKAKEIGLKEKLQEAGVKAISGDTEGVKATFEEFNGLMKETAEKTKDEKLAESLNAAVDQTNQMAEIFTNKDLDMAEKTTKIQELSNSGDKEKIAYLDEACPNLDALN